MNAQVPLSPDGLHRAAACGGARKRWRGAPLLDALREKLPADHRPGVDAPPLAIAQRRATRGRVELTPLLAAVLQGHVQVAVMLLAAGYAPVERPLQPSGARPLILAT